MDADMDGGDGLDGHRPAGGDAAGVDLLPRGARGAAHRPADS